MKYHVNINYLREPEVFSITKLSKSTRWRLERDGKFPKRRQLSTKAVGWLEQEVNEWVRSRTIVEKGAANDVK
jgi:prophage regulatory protein